MALARMLGNNTSQPYPLCVIDLPFHVFPQSVVNFDYQWQENVVSVTSDVIDIKGNTYKCKCSQRNTW